MILSDLHLFSAITPNGLVEFRSRIFGGISAEVSTIFNGSTLPQKLKGNDFPQLYPKSNFLDVRGIDFKIVPPDGLPVEAKIAVADSAYARSTIDADVPLYLPTALPDDGSNPRVRLMGIFYCGLIINCMQGNDLKKTHVVQSHRGHVERIIRKLKEFHCLQGGVVESIENMEMELDNTCAQHNLKTLYRLGLEKEIPKKAPCAPNALIITPDLDPSLKIPHPVALDSPKMPQHIVNFHQELGSIVPELEKILLGEGKEICFTNRVLARGKSLLEGCNVLQIQVQNELDGLFTLRFSVGASMKAPVYNCYVQVKKTQGVIRQACECKNG